MPDDDKTLPVDETPENGPDPLGIIGWLIGGKYRIQSYLGGGGFGEVYEGYNENLTGQRLVIKFFKRVQAREKFDKEAKILCLLDHPNISRVIDYLPDEGAVVVAYIDGKDGGIILKQSGALPEPLFLKVARAMTSAIAYAHSRKIAHRDIKPGNIIIDRNENVYLIDFGIAKEMGTDATKTAYTALTPMFAAPERQRGDRDYNPFISDIYETGITLFNFATNSLPYRNPTDPNIGEWGGRAARKLSPNLTRILKKATHPDPQKRHQSSEEFAREFNTLDRAYRSKRKKVVPLTVAALIIILAITGYYYRQEIVDTWKRFFPPQQVSVPDRPTEEAAPPETESTTEETGEPDAQQVTPETPEITEPPPVAVKKTDAVQTVPAEQAVEITPATSPAVEEEKPPPPMAHLLVTVTPSGGAMLAVDNVGRSPAERFDISPGSHDLTVVHPDYPVYRTSRRIGEGTREVEINLTQEYARADTADIQLALVPPTESHLLELSFNGRKRTITNFPYLGLTQLAGLWQIETGIIPVSGSRERAARVDSCVIFPYGGGVREVIRGHAGDLRIEDTGQGQTVSVPMLIYWTGQ